MRIYSLIDSQTLMTKGFAAEVMRSPEPPKKWDIAKKKGGMRTIYHPSSKVKLIQYWLMNNIFSKLSMHNAAYAFVKTVQLKAMLYYLPVFYYPSKVPKIHPVENFVVPVFFKKKNKNVRLVNTEKAKKKTIIEHSK